MTTSNSPDLWKDKLPKVKPDGHKYDRGHALILGAPVLTGATRLAAEACAKIGTGLVTVVGGPKGDVYRASLPPHILVRDEIPTELSQISAVLVGPGGLLPKGAEDLLRQWNKGVILDASALVPKVTEIVWGPTILTPHEGEFEQMFQLKGERVEMVRQAADMTGHIIVLKGPQTVIVCPEGRCVVNDHACPHLATAGTGDVLSGMMCGLLAQEMDPFDAACAAVWIHGEAGLRCGAGLVASDLSAIIPSVLKDLA